MKNISIILTTLSLFVSLSFGQFVYGKCGEDDGICVTGECCSKYGWCGITEEHCGDGCQPLYGDCNSGSQVTKTETIKPTATSKPTIKCSDKKIIGYYSEWKYNSYPPNKLNYDKLTHINYAFALINPNTFELEYDQKIFKEVINEAHQHGVKVLMSVGGWYGSRYFTSMTSTEANMDKFVASCKKFIENTNADGIDIDWEYPGSEGACNNPDIAKDTNNYLVLLKKLRNSIGSSLITAAVSTTTFKVNHVPLRDVKEFAEVFDFINIMAYDFAGSWSSVTSHQACLNVATKGDGISVVGAVNNWKKANFPAEKLVVGIPAYGRSFIAASAENNGLYQSIADKRPKGDEDDNNSSWTNYCGVVESSYGSVWKYKNIRKNILIKDSKTASGDWVRSWDDVAKAATLFNKNTKQVITYDDLETLEHKINYVNENGLAGIMVWELEEDTNDHELTNFIGNKLFDDENCSSNQCPDYPDYPCCNHCDTILVEGNRWGIMNYDWCSIPDSCPNDDVCWSISQGYPCCSGCDVVLEESEFKWGVENGNWCGIQTSKC